MSTAITQSAPVNNVTSAEQIFRGFITFSGSYVTNGDILDFSQQFGIMSSLPPTACYITEVTPAGTLPSGGVTMIYLPGTTKANGLVVVQAAGGAQISAAAYPASILTTTWAVEAYFPVAQ